MSCLLIVVIAVVLRSAENRILLTRRISTRLYVDFLRRIFEMLISSLFNRFHTFRLPTHFDALYLQSNEHFRIPDMLLSRIEPLLTQSFGAEAP